VTKVILQLHESVFQPRRSLHVHMVLYLYVMAIQVPF